VLYNVEVIYRLCNTMQQLFTDVIQWLSYLSITYVILCTSYL